MSGRNLIYLVHVGTLPVEADRHDRLRAIRDLLFELADVDVASIGLYVHIHGGRAEQYDDLDGCDEGEGRGDDFVPRANAECH